MASSQKGDYIDWIRKSYSPIVSRTDGSYFDMFPSMGMPISDLPWEQQQIQWLVDKGQTFYDERHRILIHKFDTVIIDGMSILYSPGRNYNISRDSETRVVSLIDRSELLDDNTRVTLGDMVDGFISILEEIIRNRGSLKHLVVVFDRSADVPIAKRHTWSHRDKAQWPKKKNDNQQFASSLPINDSVLGMNATGSYDYFAVLRDRGMRNTFIRLLCETTWHRMNDRVSLVQRAHKILLDFDSPESPLIIDCKITKTATTFKYSSKDSSDSFRNATQHTSEGDTSITSYLYMFSRKAIDSIIEVISNDADVFFNMMLVSYNIQEADVTIYYRQFGGNSHHRLFNMTEITNAVMNALPEDIEYQRLFGSIISESTKRWFAISCTFVLMVLSGNDKMPSLKGYKVKKLIKKWATYIGAVKWDELLEKRLPIIMNFHSGIATFSLNHAKKFLLYVISDELPTETDIDTKIGAYGNVLLKRFSEEARDAIEKIPADMFIRALDTLLIESNDINNHGVDPISTYVLAFGNVYSLLESDPSDLGEDDMRVLLEQWKVMRGTYGVDDETNSILLEGLEMKDLIDKILGSADSDDTRDALEDTLNYVANYYADVIVYGLFGLLFGVKRGAAENKTVLFDKLVYSIIQDKSPMLDNAIYNESVEAAITLSMHNVSHINTITMSVLTEALELVKGALHKVSKKYDMRFVGGPNAVSSTNRIAAKLWWNIIYAMVGHTPRFNGTTQQLFYYGALNERTNTPGWGYVSHGYETYSPPNPLDFGEMWATYRSVYGDNTTNNSLWTFDVKSVGEVSSVPNASGYLTSVTKKQENPLSTLMREISASDLDPKATRSIIYSNYVGHIVPRLTHLGDSSIIFTKVNRNLTITPQPIAIKDARTGINFSLMRKSRVVDYNPNFVGKDDLQDTLSSFILCMEPRDWKDDGTNDELYSFKPDDVDFILRCLFTVLLGSQNENYMVSNTLDHMALLRNVPVDTVARLFHGIIEYRTFTADSIKWKSIFVGFCESITNKGFFSPFMNGSTNTPDVSTLFGWNISITPRSVDEFIMKWEVYSLYLRASDTNNSKTLFPIMFSFDPTSNTYIKHFRVGVYSGSYVRPYTQKSMFPVQPMTGKIEWGDIRTDVGVPNAWVYLMDETDGLYYYTLIWEVNKRAAYASVNDVEYDACIWWSMNHTRFSGMWTWHPTRWTGWFLDNIVDRTHSHITNVDFVRHIRYYFRELHKVLDFDDSSEHVWYPNADMTRSLYYADSSPQEGREKELVLYYNALIQWYEYNIEKHPQQAPYIRMGNRCYIPWTRHLPATQRSGADMNALIDKMSSKKYVPCIRGLSYGLVSNSNDDGSSSHYIDYVESEVTSSLQSFVRYLVERDLTVIVDGPSIPIKNTDTNDMISEFIDLIAQNKSSEHILEILDQVDERIKDGTLIYDDIRNAGLGDAITRSTATNQPHMMTEKFNKLENYVNKYMSDASNAFSTWKKDIDDGNIARAAYSSRVIENTYANAGYMTVAVGAEYDKVYIVAGTTDMETLTAEIIGLLNQENFTYDIITVSEEIAKCVNAYVESSSVFAFSTPDGLASDGFVVGDRDVFEDIMDDEEKKTVFGLMSTQGINKPTMKRAIAIVQASGWNAEPDEDDFEDVEEGLREMFTDNKDVENNIKRLEAKIEEEKKINGRRVPSRTELKRYREELKIGEAMHHILSVYGSQYRITYNAYKDMYDFLVKIKEDKAGNRGGSGGMGERSSKLQIERNHRLTVNSTLRNQDEGSLELELLYTASDKPIGLNVPLSKFYTLGYKIKMGNQLARVEYSVLQSILTLMGMGDAPIVRYLMPICDLAKMHILSYLTRPQMGETKLLDMVKQNMIDDNKGGWQSFLTTLCSIYKITVMAHGITMTDRRTLSMKYTGGKQFGSPDNDSLYNLLIFSYTDGPSHTVIYHCEPLIVSD
jgi:hypothetical protein